MVTHVKIPKLSRTMEEGLVGRWLKKEGDQVTKGEAICEIETEKSVDELQAPETGILRKILIKDGSTGKVNQTIALITAPNEDLPENANVKTGIDKKGKEVIPEESFIESPTKKKNRIRASPLAKKMAEEKGINLENVTGTGPNGRITKDDVLNIKEQSKQRKSVPLTRIRKIIKDRLSLSARTALHVPLTIEVDMTPVVKRLEQIRPDIEAKYGIRLSITSILVKAVALAMEDHPLINATFENEEIVFSPEVNVGVAVAIEKGLVVPVIRNANKQSVIELGQRIKSLAEKARKESLSSEESTGGSFTISNLGMFDIDLFAPIINPPESCILGVGRVAKKPVIINDGITIRSMMTLTCVFDHRIMDGAVAARFLQSLKENLEQPEKILKS